MELGLSIGYSKNIGAYQVKTRDFISDKPNQNETMLNEEVPIR